MRDRGCREAADARAPAPSQGFHSRDALAPVFAGLDKYESTTHFVGQSTIFSLADGHASGETYCLAHHVTADGASRRLMVAALRYADAFAKIDGTWFFAERRLYVDWVDERALAGWGNS